MTDEQFNALMDKISEIGNLLRRTKSFSGAGESGAQRVVGVLTKDAEHRATSNGRQVYKYNIKCTEKHNGSFYVNAVKWTDSPKDMYLLSEGANVDFKGSFSSRIFGGKEYFNFTIEDFGTPENPQHRDTEDEDEDVPF